MKKWLWLVIVNVAYMIALYLRDMALNLLNGVLQSTGTLSGWQIMDIALMYFIIPLVSIAPIGLFVLFTIKVIRKYDERLRRRAMLITGGACIVEGVLVFFTYVWIQSSITAYSMDIGQQVLIAGGWLLILAFIFRSGKKARLTATPAESITIMEAQAEPIAAGAAQTEPIATEEAQAEPVSTEQAATVEAQAEPIASENDPADIPLH